jgi:hypothetical protein
MSASDYFVPRTQSLKEFLCAAGQAYVIPAYQRPYAWQDKQTHALVEDVINGLSTLVCSAGNRENFTFIGTIITAKADLRTLQAQIGNPTPGTDFVVDGQQRISTVVLLALALSVFINRQAQALVRNQSVNADIKDWFVQKLEEVDSDLLSICSFARTQRTASLPRLLRSYEDYLEGVGRLNCTFRSPIAHIINSYLGYQEAGNFELNFALTNPAGIRINSVERKRFNNFRKELELYLEGSGESSLFSKIPSGIELIRDSELIEELIEEGRLDKDFFGSLTNNQSLTDIFRIICFVKYLLNRVAVTVVEGRTEYFAFEVFESLNTTGEPLNAWETFRPAIIRGVDNYQHGRERDLINDIDSSILRQGRDVKDRQAFVSQSIILFALAESGIKQPKDLASQRDYLDKAFKNALGSLGEVEQEQQKFEFLELFKSTTYFLEITESFRQQNRAPQVQDFINWMRAHDPIAEVCLQFLIDIKHTLALGPVLPYYRRYLFADEGNARDDYIKEVAEAIKAVTGFSVMWRAAHGETAGIDSVYREIMQENFCRSLNPEFPTVSDLKRKLHEKLWRRATRGKEALNDIDTWIAMASVKPVYNQQKKLAKFILLVAHHDTEPDPESPGLIRLNRSNGADLLKLMNYQGENFFTLEHIEPQSAIRENREFLTDPDLVHRIGNLVPMPQDLNSVLSNKPWREKRILLQCATANPRDVPGLLACGGLTGVTDNTLKLLRGFSALPQLLSLGKVESESWNKALIDLRSRRLLELAGERLRSWLA